jgi:hypothetical protein
MNQNHEKLVQPPRLFICSDNKLKFSRVLSVVLIAFAIVGVALLVLDEMNQPPSYQRELDYSLTKTKLGYDYSCDQQVYSLDMVLTNEGSKLVNDLGVSLTNELCVGAIPQLPNSISPGQKIAIEMYTTSVNGTVTIIGNNTVLLVRF